MTVEEWLGEDNKLGIDIWNKKYRYDNETFDEWLDRVSNGDSEIKRLIKSKKFLFGGRILSNRGLNKGSMANCTTLGRIKDSIKDIMDANTKLALSFQAEQGQGLSLTDIRPKGALIREKYPSEGIIPFMEMFNTTTQAIQQGGNRRGALLMSISIWHKDAENFIKIKSDFNKINNANLSLEIDDEFMNIVKSDYDTGNATIVPMHVKYGDSYVDYDVCPIKLYKLICEHAYKYAEPCILYTNRLFNYNLMEYVEEYDIQCTNACSEEPLITHGLCILSSFNLSEYIRAPFTQIAFFDYESFRRDIYTVVRAMDDIITENIGKCPFDEQKIAAKRWRNFGIGIMGLADALVKLGYSYGKPNAVTFAKDIMSFLFKESLKADINLAVDRGSFEGYTEDVWKANIIKNHFSKEEIDKFVEIGKLRNCSLLSVAPNGSIGTMIGVSTGTEPFFALEYNRTTKSLNNKDVTYKCQIKTLEEYFKVTKDSKIPEFFVTAQNIPWKERIDMQAALQYSNDTAISSTCNLRESTSVKDVEQLYLYAWESGCKGMSIYVENSRPPILSTKDSVSNTQQQLTLNTIVPDTRDSFGKILNGTTYKHSTACGKLYITVNKDSNGNIVEIFTNASKNGTCKANLNGETRLASLALRAGVKVEEVVDQLKGIHCQSCAFARAKGNEIDGTSCPDIISKCIQDAYSTNTKINTNIVSTNSKVDVCPECGNPLTHESGCISCSNCGYSKCS